MNSNFKNIRLNFRKKMIFSIIPALLVVFIVLGTSIYQYLYDIFEAEGKYEITLISQDFASKFETEFAAYFNVEKQFNAVSSQYENIEINSRRKFYVDLTRDLLEKNKELVAMWIDFDKNALDKQDDKYKFVGVFPRSGRFNFAWQRGSGKITPEIETTETIIETLLDMPYYALAREKKQTVLIEPYYYSYTGDTNDKILMTSIVSPVFNKRNAVIGVTGIDITLQNYVEFIEKIKPFGVGYATLYSPEGRYLSHPNKELLEKTILENPYFLKNIVDSIHKKILAKKTFYMDFIDKNNERILINFLPVQTGIEGQEMMMAVYVPHKVLTAKINNFFLHFVAIITAVLALIIIIILLVANKLSNPLKKLSIEANKLTQGDLLLNLDTERNDEIGDLAKVLFFANQAIKELTLEIDKITIAAIAGKLNVHSDAGKFQGAYRSLVEGVNKAISVFTEPLELSMDVITVVEFPSLKVSFAAGAVEEMMGFTTEEYINRTVQEIVTPESYELIKNRIDDNLKKYYAGEIDVPQAIFEIQQYHKNGSIIWIEISAKLTLKEDGTPDKIITINRLINDRKKLERQLKESENKFAAISKNSKDLIWIVDAKTMEYTYESEAATNIFDKLDWKITDADRGFTSNEIAAGKHTFLNSMPPENAKFITELLEDRVTKYKQGEIDELFAMFEVPLIRKDGSSIWVEVSINGITDAEKNPTEYVGITRIIDDRKKLEQQLKESEQKYRLLTENARDAIWTMDLKTMRYTFKSDSSLRITGFTPEEYLTFTAMDVFPPDSVEFISNLIKREMEKYYARPYSELPEATFEVQQYHKDGSLLWVEVSARMMPPEEDGILRTIIGTTRLIDDRKKLELELKEREKKYRIVSKNTNDMIWMLNFDILKFSYVSGATEEMTGWTSEEFMDLAMTDFLPPYYYDVTTKIFQEEVDKYFNGNRANHGRIFEVQQYNKNGSLIWVEVSAKILPPDEYDVINTIVGTTRKIDDRKKLELELRERERRYRIMSENTNDMIWMLDFDNLKFLYIGGACQEVLGWTSEEYVNLRLSDFLPPYYYDVVLSAFQEEVDKHLNRNRMVQGKIFEIQQYHKDGSLIWVEVSIKAVTDENNGTSSVRLAGNVRLTGSVRLIEQRKVIELALKESEEKYALITNAVKDIIAMIDVKTLRFVFIAGAVNDLTGFTSAEYLNMTLNDVVTPESFEIIRETIAFGLKNYYEGKVNAPEAMMEVQQYHKNGSIIWMEISAKMTMEDGKPDKIISVIRRIDDRKKMELELKESEERYRFVTDNQKDFIWIINLHTLKYEFVAGAFYEILGYTFDEFLQLRVEDTVTPESAQQIEAGIRATVEAYYAGESDIADTVGEVQIFHKDGHPIWIEYSGRIINNNSAELNQIVGVIRVIEDRKAAEFQILEQKEELEQQKMELEQQKEILEQLNATKDKFFSIIAHDLKNPFAALLNMSEMLSGNYNKLGENEVKRSISLINNSSKHIYRLLENLLEWSRNSRGEITYNPLKNNIVEIINDCVYDLRTQANVKNIKIEIPDTLMKYYVLCDMNMIHTVLRNLISNAIKFSFNDSAISISVIDYSADNNYIQVSVKDSGVGINESDISKLFRIDSKMSTTGTAKEKGTGLGLIICKEFIDRHHCKIWVTSEKDKGTTFFFTLPKAERVG